MPPQYREILENRNNECNPGLPNIIGHLLRHTDSYKTVDGKNQELRGKDFMIFENKSTGESVTIYVSSVANMDGFGVKDTLSENDFTFTYDPNSGSKYAPEVFTITSGNLFPSNVLQQNGDALNSYGITDNNSVPWRGHNTKRWSSQGCITAQKGNEKGDFTTVIQTLHKWGIQDTYNIPFSFGLGVY